MYRPFYISLGIFCLLFAVMTVSNLKITWMSPICGFSAGVCGIICLVCAAKDTNPPGRSSRTD
jgi:TRAP-type mannitol/chloroaromatic compound transport system permease large subunit